VPGFVEEAEELKSKGVDEILLISGIAHIISSEFCILDSCS
jgi:peroxiredoxin